MSNKKEELKKLISQFTKEELIEILSDSEPSEEKGDTSVHKIDSGAPTERRRSRRGRGGRKKNKRNSSRSTRGSKGSACRVKGLDTSGQRPNKFIDFMKDTVLSSSERAELDQASKEDQQHVSERVPRTRSSSLVEVECRICGSVENVSAAVVYDSSRWKCNQCAAQACDS
jgi:hypothetical protein